MNTLALLEEILLIPAIIECETNGSQYRGQLLASIERRKASWIAHIKRLALLEEWRRTGLEEHHRPINWLRTGGQSDDMMCGVPYIHRWCDWCEGVE
jgi:hypothetical protein